MEFIVASNRRELNKKLDSMVHFGFAVIKKVSGGYMCFETTAEYDSWKNQK